MMEVVEPRRSADPPITASESTLSPVQRLSERQIEAVYAVMRLLRDDGARPGGAETIDCDRCRRGRPSQGSVAYGATLLCNGCATDYELLRAARNVRGIEDFLGISPAPGRSEP